MPQERFQLKSADCNDPGMDLRAVHHGSIGTRNCRRTPFKNTRHSTIAFCDDERMSADVAASRIARPSVTSPIIWLAWDGKARKHKAQRSKQPGRYVNRGHSRLTTSFETVAGMDDDKQLQVIDIGISASNASRHDLFGRLNRQERPRGKSIFKRHAPFGSPPDDTATKRV